ncbi:AAA family ATPase [Oscillochloris sp. ZM17-4]|uniref:ATP-binding protein n=1 Tax=Oscillochloris sp. ZM17-4 TaxID=2866714 RepID=UPI001C72FF80|nr:AAA family ATPase [Oscillochloris sp. ZM17-4]MBX0329160.1 AAA family ATPase [Oscillochloris sp. ZM17-4]
MTPPDSHPAPGANRRAGGPASQPPISTPGGVAGVTATMVGRDGALQQLLARLYELLDGGDAQLITILGDPGIGKTRLAFEFYQQLSRLPEPLRFYRFKADIQRIAQPYGMVRQMIAALFELDENDHHEATIARLERGVTAMLGEGRFEDAHILGFLAGLELDESPHLSGLRHNVRAIRDRAIQIAMQLIVRITAHAPMVLMIDDVQDVDDSSLDMIEHAAQISAGESLMIICLAQRRLIERRPRWGEGAPGAALIELQPLDEHQSRRLVGEILRKAGKLPPDLRNLIVSRAAGNPLYVEELIKMLVADGVIVPAPDKWQIQVGRLPRLRIPSTLTELLRARLQSLSRAERAYLAAASVSGSSFWAGAAAAMAGYDEPRSAAVEAILRALESSYALIVPQPEPALRGEREYRFSHDLMREVIYEQIAPEQRATYHRRMADWLIANSGDRADSYAGLIADHYERGGDLRYAGHWQARAAAQARAAYVLDTAITHYQHAIQLLAGYPEAAADLLVAYAELGQSQFEAARFADANASFRQTRELARQAGDRQAEARALERLAAIADDMSDLHAMLDYAQQALDLARAADDPTQIVMSMADMSMANLRLGDTQRGLDLAQEALVIAQQAGYGAGIAKCLGHIALTYEQLGDMATALRYTHEAVARFRELGDLTEMTMQINNLGYIANAQGDFASARAFLEEGLHVARETGIRNMEIYLLSNLGTSLVGMGSYVEAEEVVRRGIQICEQSRIKPFPDFYRDLSAVYLHQGRVIEAVEAAQRGLNLARDAVDPREVGVSWRALGAAMAELAEPLGAALCFVESARLLDTPGLIADRGRTLRAWAAHELRSGDPDRGRALQDQARALFVQAGLTHEIERTPDAL